MTGRAFYQRGAAVAPVLLVLFIGVVLGLTVLRVTNLQTVVQFPRAAATYSCYVAVVGQGCILNTQVPEDPRYLGQSPCGKGGNPGWPGDPSGSDACLNYYTQQTQGGAGAGPGFGPLCPPGSDCDQAASKCINQPNCCTTNPLNCGWPDRAFCTDDQCNSVSDWSSACTTSGVRCEGSTCPSGFSLKPGSGGGTCGGTANGQTCQVTCQDSSGNEQSGSDGSCRSISTPKCRCGHFWHNPDPSICAQAVALVGGGSGGGTGGGGNNCGPTAPQCVQNCFANGAGGWKSGNCSGCLLFCNNGQTGPGSGGGGPVSGAGTLKIVTSGNCAGQFIMIVGPTASGSTFVQTQPADNLGIWARKSTTPGNYKVELLGSDKSVLKTQTAQVPLNQMATVNIACTGTGTGGGGAGGLKIFVTDASCKAYSQTATVRMGSVSTCPNGCSGCNDSLCTDRQQTYDPNSGFVSFSGANSRASYVFFLVGNPQAQCTVSPGSTSCTIVVGGAAGSCNGASGGSCTSDSQCGGGQVCAAPAQ